MKKSELASHVAAQSSLSKAQAERVVDAVFSAIGEALASGESVVIPGFGTFTPDSVIGFSGIRTHQGIRQGPWCSHLPNAPAAHRSSGK